MKNISLSKIFIHLGDIGGHTDKNIFINIIICTANTLDTMAGRGTSGTV